MFKVNKRPVWSSLYPFVSSSLIVPVTEIFGDNTSYHGFSKNVSNRFKYIVVNKPLKNEQTQSKPPGQKTAQIQFTFSLLHQLLFPHQGGADNMKNKKSFHTVLIFFSPCLMLNDADPKTLKGSMYSMKPLGIGPSLLVVT